MRRAIAVLAGLFLSGSAIAQTTPNWALHYVPPPAEWNALWASKQDYNAPGKFTTLATVGNATITGNLTVTGTINGGGGSFLPLIGGTLTGDLNTSGRIVSTLGNLKFGNLGSNGWSFQNSAGGNSFVIAGQAAVAANQITVTPGATGSSPSLVLGGTDATVGLNINSKNGGMILLNGSNAVWAGPTLTVGKLQATGLTGTSTGSAAPIFSVQVIDSINRSGLLSGPVTAFNIEHDYGGGTTKGGRMALNVLLLQSGGANTDTGQANFYTGGRFTSFARFTQPGSSPTNPLGLVFGLNVVSAIQAGFTATNYAQVSAAEFNVGISAGSSADIRSGLTIADLGGTAQGASTDAMHWLYNVNGAGWRYGIMFSDTQPWPMDTTVGTMFGANYGAGFNAGALTTKWGIDLQQVTFPATGNAYDGGPFRSNGWSIDGAGRMQIGSAYFTWGASGLAIDAKGSVGVSATIATAGSGYEDGFLVVQALGGLWTVGVVTGTGIPAGAVTPLVQPVSASTTPPANPVTVTNQRRASTGSGLTLNITWNTTATGLALQVSGGATTIGGSLGVTGIVTGPTAAVDTNTTQFATTAFVLAQAAAATPLIDGTATVGTSTRYARADHIHPTDTTRAALSGATFTGAVVVGNNTTQQLLAVNGPAVSNRVLAWQTAGSKRWQWNANNTAEGGANAGSDMVLSAFDDTGTLLFAPLSITRSTGTIAFGTLVRFNGSSVVANGAIATTMTSLGPTGSHTTIQEWLSVQNASGTTRYIPLY